MRVSTRPQQPLLRLLLVGRARHRGDGRGPARGRPAAGLRDLSPLRGNAGSRTRGVGRSCRSHRRNLTDGRRELPSHTRRRNISVSEQIPHNKATQRR
jgi:hypothetical protein